MNSCSASLRALSTSTLFESLKPGEMKGLLQGGAFKSLKDREVLFREGDPADFFAIVTKGALKLVKTRYSGSESIMFFAVPFEVLGVPLMLLPKARYPISSVALGSTEVFLLPRERYLNEWCQNASVQLRLRELINARMEILQGDKLRSRMGLKARVSGKLLELPRVKCGESWISLHLRRHDLAAAIGCTTEALIRTLGKMEKEGLIQVQSRRIKILQPERLAAIVKGPG